MNSLAWLLPAALTLGLLGLAGFIWSLRSGQFDDLEGSAWRALEDRDPAPDKTLAPDKAAPPDKGPGA